MFHPWKATANGGDPYPKEHITGLWILDKEALKKFDEIIDSFTAKFQEQKKQDIEAEYLQRRRDFLEDPIYAKWDVEKQQQKLKEIQVGIETSYQFVKDKRELKLKLESGKTLTVQRFSELENDREVQDDAPIEFSLSLQYGLINLETKIGAGLLGGFEASVTPATPGLTQQCLLALRQWAEEHKIHKAFFVWYHMTGFHWMVVVVVLGLLTLITSSVAAARATAPSPSPGRLKLREEARELAKRGIQTQQDERRAIELTIALQSDYDPDTPPPSPGFRMPAWFWLVSGLIVALAILLTFPPRTSIAVGKKGIEQVAWMKWWTNHTFYTIPTLFATIFISPLLKDAVQKIF